MIFRLFSGCKPMDRHVVDFNFQTLLSLAIGVSLHAMSSDVEADRRDLRVDCRGISSSSFASERTCCLDERSVAEGVTADDRLVPGPGVDEKARLLFLFRSDDCVSVLLLFLPFVRIVRSDRYAIQMKNYIERKMIEWREIH